MKKLLVIISAAATMLFAACGHTTQSNPDGIVLNLDISGLPAGTMMQILPGATQQPEEPIQTVSLIDGKAQFTFDVEGPRLYYVMAQDTYGVMKVALDKGDVAILSAKANYKEATSNKSSCEYLDMKVSGSSLQDEYIRRSVDRDALNNLYEEYHKIQDADAFAAAEKRFFSVVDSTFKAKIMESADSWWGPMILLDSYSYISKEQEEEYNQLSDAAKESHYGKLLHDLLWPPSLEGKTMPNFTFTNKADGRKLSLQQALNGNKYLLLDFWASWCKPCRNEIPNLKRLYDLYHGKGFEIVSISADDNEKAWLKALDDEKLPWLNDRDGQQGIVNLYKVQYYPTVYLLDGEGKVVAKDIRGEELANKLQQLFQ